MTRPCQQDCQGNKWDQLLHVHKIHHVAINYIITLFHCSSKHELSGHDNASRTEEEGRWRRNCRGNKRVALSHVHASQPPLDLQLCLYLCFQFYLYLWEINKLYFHTSTLLRHHNSKLLTHFLASVPIFSPSCKHLLSPLALEKNKKKNLRPSVILIHFHLFWSLWWNAPFEPIIGEMTRNKSLAKCNKYGKMKQIIGKM